MVMSEIQEKIDYYNGCADDCIRQIDELNQKMEQAITVSSNLEGYLRRVGEDMEARKNRLSIFGCDGVRSSILQKYFDGMNALLTGGEYQQKYNDLDQGLQRINRTINDMDDQLAQLAGQRDDAWNNKYYWEQQMPYAEDYPA